MREGQVGVQIGNSWEMFDCPDSHYHQVPSDKMVGGVSFLTFFSETGAGNRPVPNLNPAVVDEVRTDTYLSPKNKDGTYRQLFHRRGNRRNQRQKVVIPEGNPKGKLGEVVMKLVKQPISDSILKYEFTPESTKQDVRIKLTMIPWNQTFFSDVKTTFRKVAEHDCAKKGFAWLEDNLPTDSRKAMLSAVAHRDEMSAMNFKGKLNEYAMKNHDSAIPTYEC